MTKQRDGASDSKDRLVGHGAQTLPSVTIDSYNLELRDKDGFIGDRASKSAFQQKLEDWRKRLRKVGDDPLGKAATKDLSKKQVDALMSGDDKEAAALVMSAVDDYAEELAAVLMKFLKQKDWAGTERIVVGGGLKDSAFGELAIARAMVRIKGAGIAVDLVPIVHHPDEAGLIGAAHLMPAWMLQGYDAILAVDIGGTNIRAGIVEMRPGKRPRIYRRLGSGNPISGVMRMMRRSVAQP